MSPRQGKADRIAGGVLALAGVAAGIEATTYDVAFLTDPVGPKALPLLVAATMVFAGARMLLRPRDSIALPNTDTLLRMAGAMVAFLLYAAALPWIGFFLSTTIVVAALGVLYRGPWKGGLVAGLVLSSALWLLFVGLLSLPLPVGELWIL